MQLVHVLVCGDPLVLLVSTKVVPPHTDVLTDYGEGYWERVRENGVRAAATRRLADAMQTFAWGIGSPADPIHVGD